MTISSLYISTVRNSWPLSNLFSFTPNYNGIWWVQYIHTDEISSMVNTWKCRKEKKLLISNENLCRYVIYIHRSNDNIMWCSRPYLDVIYTIFAFIHSSNFFTLLTTRAKKNLTNIICSNSFIYYVINVKWTIASQKWK